MSSKYFASIVCDRCGLELNVPPDSDKTPTGWTIFIRAKDKSDIVHSYDGGLDYRVIKDLCPNCSDIVDAILRCNRYA